MRVRLLYKPKPDNYTESCMVNVTDGWRERNVWYPGRSARNAPKRRNRSCKAALNAQKSAEAIVPWGKKTHREGRNQYKPE